ncbi:hypothetical protein OB919_15210 [Halobacteria archaeon AArc-curdl1]|uniref:Uncharacterized protein n=1 Tax=Natronosalvus hydrolyticus TaxID=2979988 RepID=A0AAP3E7W0_9EURY|nr:hypothetical protein [Halobacteria archaeon AArc-curdl1]
MTDALTWQDLFERGEAVGVDLETIRTTRERLRAEATEGGARDDA